MKTSHAPDPQNIVASVVRFDRDSFFDNMIGATEPLTPETAGRTHMSEGAVYGDVPEVPNPGPQSAVIIGRFADYDSILSASHRSVYTELHVSVQEVIRPATNVQINGSTVIPIAVPGGTVDLPDGGALSYLTDAQAFALQPGHTYLLVITYKGKGEFFLVDKSWDVTNGIVNPNTSHEAYRSQRGLSKLAGLPVKAAVAEIKRQLSEK